MFYLVFVMGLSLKCIVSDFLTQIFSKQFALEGAYLTIVLLYILKEKSFDWGLNPLDL